MPALMLYAVTFDEPVEEFGTVVAIRHSREEVLEPDLQDLLGQLDGHGYQNIESHPLHRMHRFMDGTLGKVSWLYDLI